MRYRTIGTGPEARRVSVIALGAMKLGGTVDEDTSFAVLDRFVEAGGTFVDTSNNYMFWEPGCTPDDSELLIGRWRAARGLADDDELVIGTKFGTRPTVPGGGVEHWKSVGGGRPRCRGGQPRTPGQIADRPLLRHWCARGELNPHALAGTRT